MHCRGGVSLLMVFVLVFGVLLVSCPAFAVQGGFSRPYTHYADDEDLTVILTNFARSQGLGASFSPGVVGKVSGRFDAVPPETFLKGMQAAFGVTWYRLGSTLYFYSESELSRTFITPRAMTAERLYQMLRQSALFAPQLPATLAPGGAMIVVSGPPTYLAQISAAVTAFEEAQITNFVMKVFPLKYAWAEDMSVNSMDKTVTIPGVASILRAMVTGSPNSATRVTQDTATVDKLSGTGLIAQGRMTPVAPDAPAPAAQQGGQAAPQNATQVNIMADPRVNAVLVNDAEYRMPYYAKVIADLDRPVELVEIHAAIVDIDSDFKRDLGVTYQGANSRDKGWSTGGEFSGTGDKFSPLPTMGTPSGTGMNLSTIYTHGADFFLARIQALEAEGEARMLGRPSVLTVDNVQATLENTSTYYIQVEGYQAVDLFKVEAGTVLRVTPHIIRNERGQTSIKLAVSVQDDQNDSKDAPVSDNSVPPIKQTKINTQAIVGAGQSLLIGGYYYEQKSTDASGIPILMHIPVLGNLFKTTSKGTKRMERLIQSLLRLERLCADGYEFTYDEQKVASIIRSCWAGLSATFPACTVEVIGNAIIRCDEKWLSEAFTNLLKNACEHMPEGGTVHVRMETTEAAFFCTVEDEGGGASGKDLPHLFERFYRAEGSPSSGAGIGLAIVREIIWRHHGTISAENTAKGLKMTISIPLMKMMVLQLMPTFSSVTPPWANQNCGLKKLPTLSASSTAAGLPMAPSRTTTTITPPADRVSK